MIKLLVNLRVKTLGGQGGVPLGAREEDSNNDNGDIIDNHTTPSYINTNDPMTVVATISVSNNNRVIV